MSGLDLDFAAGVGLLLDAGLKATVVLLGALAATRLMRRRSAASRHLVWVVALAAVLALPALGRLLPAWRALPLPAFLRPVPAAPAATPLTAAQPVSPPTSAAASAPEAASAQPSEPSTALLAPTPPASAPAAAPARPPLPFDWRMALLALWAAGGVLLAARLAYGLLRVRWIERRATEITDEGWVHITDSLARRLRVGRMVTLLREAHASVPMTWGVLRPVVLLPQEAEAWDRERRTVVLAHELAHIRRWDPLTQWIAHLALALFWFHPLVWVAARRMREERERACDDAVLALGTRPVSYADHLLDIVRSLGSAEGPAAALAMARRSQFEGRLLAILDQATPRGGVSRGLGLAALVVAAVAVVPLAALRAAEPRPPDPSGPVTAAARVVPPAEAARTAERPRETEKPEAPGLLARLGGRIGDVLEGMTEPPAPAAEAAEPQEPAAQPETGTALLGERKVETVAREQSVTSTEARALIQAVQDDTGTYRLVIRAAGGISSASERASVLLAVLRQGDIGREDMVSLLRVAGGITSDGERREVLKAAARSRLLSDGEVRRAFFAAVAGITSSGERRDVLMSVVRGGGSAALIPDVVHSTRAITSDGERRLVLKTVTESAYATPAVLAAVVAAAREMSSPGERREVLKAVALRPVATPDVLTAVVAAAREIPSPGEQREVLKIVLSRPGVTEPVLLSAVDAVRHVPSASEQREIYTGVLARPVVGDNVLAAVLEGVPHMNSSGEQGLVMRTIAARRPLSSRVREAYLRAANAISSDVERAGVLAALLGGREARAAASQSGGRAVQEDGTTLEHLWNADVELDLDGGRQVRIVAKDVKFARHRWDITRIRRGGRLLVEETAPGRARRLEITPGPSGGLRHSYRVNGVARPFDPEGESWMIAIIRELTGS